MKVVYQRSRHDIFPIKIDNENNLLLIVFICADID